MRDKTERPVFWLVAIVGLVFFCSLFFRVCNAQASELTPAEDRQLVAVNGYISDYLRIYKNRLQAALKLVPTVVAVAREHGLDPLLFAVHVSAESSWRPEAVGARGEIGLTQIMPNGICATAGLEQPEQQLRAGAACLASCFERCATEQSSVLEQRTRAFTAYLSGKCRTTSELVLRRASYRARLVAVAERRFYPEASDGL